MGWHSVSLCKLVTLVHMCALCPTAVTAHHSTLINTTLRLNTTMHTTPCHMGLQVVNGECTNGASIVRPPGHHAETHCAKGFCIYNNVAVAAAAARDQCGVKRVLVLDWDVHHGNGIQHMFEDDDSVMYVSLHRYDE